MLALKYGEFEIARFICSWTYLSGRMFCVDVNFSLWYGKWHIEVKRKKNFVFFDRIGAEVGGDSTKTRSRTGAVCVLSSFFVKN